MSLEALTYTFVVGSFVIYIAIAFWSRASSTQEFYVAGGGVTPLANGMATAADWMSAASFISLAGIVSLLAMTLVVILWVGRVAMFCWRFCWPLICVNLVNSLFLIL